MSVNDKKEGRLSNALGLGRGTPGTQQCQPCRRRPAGFHSQCQADSPVRHREECLHRELHHRPECDHRGQLQAQEPDNEIMVQKWDLGESEWLGGLTLSSKEYIL